MDVRGAAPRKSRAPQYRSKSISIDLSTYLYLYIYIRLYLDAEVLVLPPVFYPQDSCFVGRRLFVVNQPPPTRSQFRLLCWCGLSMRGVSVIPRAVSLRVSISQSTGILGIPLPAPLSYIIYIYRVEQRVVRRAAVQDVRRAASRKARARQYTFIYLCLSIYLSIYRSTHLYIYTGYIYIPCRAASSSTSCGSRRKKSRVA